jgi:hypothetical protein
MAKVEISTSATSAAASIGPTTPTTFTAGSVIFSNGTTLAQDNANFFWDDTNDRLGIGTTTPNASLDIATGYTVSGPHAGSFFAYSAENATPVNYFTGDVITYRIWARYFAGGQFYFSNSYYETSPLTITTGVGFASVDIYYDPAGGTPIDYVIVRDLNSNGFAHYAYSQDTSGYQFDSNGGGSDLTWIAGTVDTSVTSVQVNTGTKLNYYNGANTFGLYTDNYGYFSSRLGIGTVTPGAMLDVYTDSLGAARLRTTASVSTLIVRGLNDGGYGTYSQIDVRDSSDNKMLLFGDSQAGAANSGVLNFLGIGTSSGDFRGELTFMAPTGGDVRVSTWRIFQDGAAATDSGFYLLLRRGGSFVYQMYANSKCNTGFRGITSPTAAVHLDAGSTAAEDAPLKFTSGPLMTTAEAGAVEFLTDKFYATITTGAARKELALVDVALTSGRVPFATTNGRLVDDVDLTYNSGTDTLFVKNLTISGTVSGLPVYVNAVSGTVDFGFASGKEETIAVVTVAAAWVAAGTKLVCAPFAVATATHDADDYAAEGIVAYASNIVPGVGFDIVAMAPSGTFGRYVIHAVGV